jgi:hypothetical protein
VAYAPVNLVRLGEVEKGTLVTPDVLAHDGLIANTKSPVKILGVGDAPAGITIHAHAFSKAALDKLTAAGSTAQRLGWPGNEPLEDVMPGPRKQRARKGRKAAPAAEADDAADEAAEEPEPAADTETQEQDSESETDA